MSADTDLPCRVGGCQASHTWVDVGASAIVTDWEAPGSW